MVDSDRVAMLRALAEEDVLLVFADNEAELSNTDAQLSTSRLTRQSC
jgi:hypothetical protein